MADASDELDAIPDTILRDLNATAALIAMGTSTPTPSNYSVNTLMDHAEAQRRRAEYAYAQADAMLAARKVRPA